MSHSPPSIQRESSHTTHSTRDATSDIMEVTGGSISNVTADDIMPAFGFNLNLSDFIVLWPTWLVVVASVVLCAATVTNLWILTNWVCSPNIWKSSFHILLMNHTLANFLLDALPYPAMVYRMTTMTVEGSGSQTTLCRAWSSSLIFLVFVVLACNGLIAVNRAVACYPHVKLASKLRGRKPTTVAVMTMWLTFFTSLTLAITLDTYGWDRTFVCLPIVQLVQDVRNPELVGRGKTLQLLNSRSFATVAAITLVVCCSSYVIIARHLWIKQHRFVSTSSAAAAKRLRERKRALAVIMATFTSFIVCWMPTALALAYKADLIRQNPVLMALPVLDSFLDPLLYMLTMPAFQTGFCIRHGAVGVTSNSHDPAPPGQTGVHPRSTQGTRTKPDAAGMNSSL